MKFEAALQRQDDLHAKYDLSFTTDNLKVAAVQAEEEAEAVAEQFLKGFVLYSLIISNIHDLDSICLVNCFPKYVLANTSHAKCRILQCAFISTGKCSHCLF